MVIVPVMGDVPVWIVIGIVCAGNREAENG
jgi:hypothetical protein